MDFGIKGKFALITGGGRGLGRNMAQHLIDCGVKVAIVSRTESDLELFIKENGKEHRAYQGDLTQEGEPKRIFDLLKKDFAAPDMVIHNAGGNLDITDPMCGLEDWRRVMRFNLEIAVEMNPWFVNEMRLKKWGRIVHISSIAGLENQGTVPYCSAKAALNAYVRSFGRYVASDGISVSAVLPGAVFTEGGYWDHASTHRPDHVKKYLEERMAIKRFGTLDEIGSVVAFLCSKHSSFVVGSSFLIDGGQGRAFQTDALD